MKSLLLFLLSTFIVLNLNAQAKKQNTITISADIKGLKDKNKYYLNGSATVGLDSCIARNGQLHFKYTGEPEQVSIGRVKDSGVTADDLSVVFWTDKQDMKITGEKGDNNNMDISGSALWDSFMELNKIIGPLQDKRNEIIESTAYHSPDSIKFV